MIFNSHMQLAGYINILRQDVESMHCYQLAWEQLEFGAGPAWDVQHQPGSFSRDGSFLMGLK